MILISPDNKTILKQNGNILVDSSGNKYYIKNGIYYLLPVNPIKQTAEIKYLDHQIFRDYKFSKSLRRFRVISSLRAIIRE